MTAATHFALYGVACELAAVLCVVASLFAAGREHRGRS